MLSECHGTAPPFEIARYATSCEDLNDGRCLKLYDTIRKKSRGFIKKKKKKKK